MHDLACWQSPVRTAPAVQPTWGRHLASEAGQGTSWGFALVSMFGLVHSFVTLGLGTVTVGVTEPLGEKQGSEELCWEPEIERRAEARPKGLCHW